MFLEKGFRDLFKLLFVVENAFALEDQDELGGFDKELRVGEVVKSFAQVNDLVVGKVITELAQRE